MTDEKGDTGVLTPLEVFYHELGHILNYYESKEDYNSREANKDPLWTNLEEQFTIQKYEYVIVKEFDGTVRADHKGKPIWVDSPYSREKEQ